MEDDRGAIFTDDPSEQRANKIIKEAEAANCLFELPKPGEGQFCINPSGEPNDVVYPMKNFDITNQFIHLAMVDEKYSMVATHVDELTYNKVIGHGM